LRYLWERKKFNGTQVFYTASITENEADILGAYLISSGFADGKTKTVQLNKSKNTYEVRMVVIDGYEQDQEYKNLVKTYASEIAENVFKGSQVDIHLCNDKLQTIVVIPMHMVKVITENKAIFAEMDKLLEDKNSPPTFVMDNEFDDDDSNRDEGLVFTTIIPEEVNNYPPNGIYQVKKISGEWVLIGASDTTYMEIMDDVISGRDAILVLHEKEDCYIKVWE
jgi:hypothetical protein